MTKCRYCGSIESCDCTVVDVGINIEEVPLLELVPVVDKEKRRNE